MTTRPASNRHAATAALTLIGPTSYLSQFFASSSLPLQSAAAVTTKAQTVRVHVRRRGPGAPGSVVKQHPRSVSSETGNAGSQAKPGERFWCERPSGTGAARRSNAKQFSYEGSWKDLKAFARLRRTGADYILRNSSGRSVVIKATSTAAT
jgi:hypothetical protein